MKKIKTVFKLDSEMKILNYRYTEKESLFHILREIPIEYQIGEIKTEHDFIKNYINEIRNACEGEFKETDIKCWEGHYEQFALVMLHLANLIYKRKDFRGESLDNYGEFLPRKAFAEFLFEGNNCTEDRLFYRSWLRLLSHPSFISSDLTFWGAFIDYFKVDVWLKISIYDLELKIKSLEQAKLNS